MSINIPINKKININKNPKQLKTFTLTLLTISAILNLRGLPIMALLGMHAFFYYLLGIIGFLIPSAIVCTRLSTRTESEGGIYAWVSKAFGPKTGFISMWMEWINNVIAFPATAATIIATILMAINPHWLNHHSVLFLISVLILLWAVTLFNILPITISSKLNIIGALFGTILPGLLIIILAYIHWADHHFILNNWQKTSVFPWNNLNQSSHHPFHFSHNIALFVSVLGSLSGMQITGFYRHQTHNPSQTFPKALTYATLIIILLSAMGVYALDLVITPSHINIIAGVMQAFYLFFNKLHYPILGKMVSILLILGMLASLSAWMGGPAKGFLTAWKKNRAHSNLTHTQILFIQGLLTSLLSILFISFAQLDQAFWVLIALTSQFTVLMYIFVFSAGLKQTLPSHPHTQKLGLKCLYLLGILSCLIGFCVGLVPPKSLHWSSPGNYLIWMMCIDGFLIFLPFLFL